MNKAELISTIVATTDLNKKEADAALNAALDAITEALKKGEKVQLVGFGTFAAKAKAASVARNPKTGEQIQVPAHKVPTFSAGKALKDAIQ